MHQCVSHKKLREACKLSNMSVHEDARCALQCNEGAYMPMVAKKKAKKPATTTKAAAKPKAAVKKTAAKKKK